MWIGCEEIVGSKTGETGQNGEGYHFCYWRVSLILIFHMILLKYGLIIVVDNFCNTRSWWTSSIIVFDSNYWVLSQCGPLVTSNIVSNDHSIVKWTPSIHWCLFVPEVLRSHILQVIYIHVWNSCCYFCSVYKSS